MSYGTHGALYSYSTVILYGIIRKDFEQFFYSKAGWGESLGALNIRGVGFVGFVVSDVSFKAIEYLPGYVWDSYKNNKVNSQPPSFTGSYFLKDFFFMSCPRRRALMDRAFHYKKWYFGDSS